MSEPVDVPSLAARLRSRLAELPSPAKVIFAAPADVDGEAAWAAATAVAGEAGLARWAGYGVARTDPVAGGGMGLGEAVTELAATGRAAAVVVCPLGPADEAVAEAGARARQAGLAFAAT